ncbi:MAG TPA: serine/threonine-protein kinase [Candidatus Obscuribacter sp.]|nr:serine/threonine-protein kinase [Candidatus Obscuribacter sp.]
MKGAGQAEKGKVCASCKRALPSGAKFCGFDGTRVDDQVENRNNGSNDKQCSKCGKFYPSYAQFCPADATKLADVKAEAVNPEVKPSPFAPPPGFAPPQPAKPQAPEPVAPVSQSQPPAPSQDLTETAPPIDEELARSGDFGRNQAEPRKPTQLAESFDDDNAGLFHNLIGKKIEGKYEVQSILGEGGMAIVYKAYHTKMERLVVIKVMQGWLLSNKNAVERFERESKTTAKLAHPNIVTVFDYGVLNGKEPYLVMEYIKGESLGDKIARQGALPFATAAGIIIQICRGLQEAHSVGIIHRDLKPDNILLQDRSDRPDWVKIVDFGISHLVQGAKRLTKTGKMVGTPEYIAPEQLKDKPLDIRTDLYALGIILYETLTGRVPFEGESAEGILMKHLLEPPPPLSLHNDDFAEGTPFDAIIAKALRKEPDERYQTATEFRLDVEEALNKVLLKRNSK